MSGGVRMGGVCEDGRGVRMGGVGEWGCEDGRGA